MTGPNSDENKMDRPAADAENELGNEIDSTSLAVKTKNHLWWQIAALLIVSALAVYTGKAFDSEWKRFAPEPRQLASTYNDNATGLKGLFQLAQQQGDAVATWEQPYRQLREVKGMLVVIAPTESLQPFQAEQILAWVHNGNDLVYIDDLSFAMTDHFARTLGVKIKNHKSLTDKAPDTNIIPTGHFPELAHVKNLRIASSVRLKGGEPLAEDGAGALLTVVKHGGGRVLLGSCPSILANNTIAKKDYWGNFQLLANWFKTAHGTIYFDEYSHGFSGGTNVFAYLAKGPTGLVVAQIFAILVIGVLSESQRFGAARSIESRRRISNLDFINGLSNAYRRARANPAVMEILFHSFRNRLSRALAVSPHEPLERLKEAWQQSKFQTTYNLDVLIGQYEEFMTRRSVSDAELKTMLETCDKITESTQESSNARSITSSKS
ncbi:MAG: DUF4350 domain-containing protein [Candidatus Melainabacteria bacterium]|nr:DUF4350 domain-containing protein [Candidatus Melainabacteria bacterium]